MADAESAGLMEDEGGGVHGLQHSPEVAPGDICAHPP